MSTVAVIGLGEDGSLLASGLHAAGFTVVGFDVQLPKTPVVSVADSLEEAVSQADVVFSLNSAVAALRVAEQAAAHLPAGAFYADLNPGTPGTKKKLAGLFPDGAFVDVAVMGSLADEGLAVTLGVSGKRAQEFINLFSAAAPHLVYVSDVPGDAAARNLLRSLLTKALAGAVVDTLWAAENLGQEQWAWEEIQHVFDSLDAETAQRLISETALNFKRSQVELMDVVEMLTEADYESTMAAPLQFNYGRIMHNKKIPFAAPVPTEGTWTQPPTL